jgi:predicted DNA-binding transcriptional regulator YafY
MVKYEPFGKEPFEFHYHPYFLKQYNNRWFVFGRNNLLGANQWNIPLDRILTIRELGDEYIEDNTNWEDYFSDFIGVSKTDEELIEIKLLFTKEQAPYIMTKPIHETQKSNNLDDGNLEVRIKVIPNYELETMLLSFGEKVKILSPNSLIRTIEQRLNKAAKQY